MTLLIVLSSLASRHFPLCFPNIHSKLIFSFTPKSSKWFFPFGFYDQNVLSISYLSRACYMPAHLILLDLITRSV